MENISKLINISLEVLTQAGEALRGFTVQIHEDCDIGGPENFILHEVTMYARLSSENANKQDEDVGHAMLRSCANRLSQLLQEAIVLDPESIQSTVLADIETCLRMCLESSSVIAHQYAEEDPNHFRPGSIELKEPLKAFLEYCRSHVASSTACLTMLARSNASQTPIQYVNAFQKFVNGRFGYLWHILNSCRVEKSTSSGKDMYFISWPTCITWLRRSLNQHVEQVWPVISILPDVCKKELAPKLKRFQQLINQLSQKPDWESLASGNEGNNVAQQLGTFRAEALDLASQIPNDIRDALSCVSELTGTGERVRPGNSAVDAIEVVHQVIEILEGTSVQVSGPAAGNHQAGPDNRSTACLVQNAPEGSAPLNRADIYKRVDMLNHTATSAIGQVARAVLHDLAAMLTLLEKNANRTSERGKSEAADNTGLALLLESCRESATCTSSILRSMSLNAANAGRPDILLPLIRVRLKSLEDMTGMLWPRIIYSAPSPNGPELEVLQIKLQWPCHEIMLRQAHAYLAGYRDFIAALPPHIAIHLGPSSNRLHKSFEQMLAYKRESECHEILTSSTDLDSAMLYFDEAFRPYREDFIKAVEELRISLGDTCAYAGTDKDQADLAKAIELVKASGIHETLRDTISYTLYEAGKCVSHECWVATIALTGRIFEACLKQLILIGGEGDIDDLDRLGISALWNRTRNLDAVRDAGIEEGWLDILSCYRNANVHDRTMQGRSPVPSARQVNAALNICIDLIHRVVAASTPKT